MAAGDVDEFGAIDGQREGLAQVFARGSRERALLEVVAHPGRAGLGNELQLARLRTSLDPQDVLRRDVTVHVAKADVVKAVLVVLGNGGGEVGDDVDVDLLENGLR